MFAKLRFRQRNQAISKTKATAVSVYKDKDDMIAYFIIATLYILAALAGIFTTVVLIFAYRVKAWQVFDQTGEML
jgi:uncharacterized membrane protein